MWKIKAAALLVALYLAGRRKARGAAPSYVSEGMAPGDPLGEVGIGGLTSVRNAELTGTCYDDGSDVPCDPSSGELGDASGLPPKEDDF